MSSTILSATTKVVVPGIWNKVSSVPAKYPFAFGVLFSGCKTSFSDLLVQKVIERKEEIDWRRNCAFATFGFLYLGGVQYMIYVPFFGTVFTHARTFVTKPFREKIRDVRGISQTIGQVFLDQCIHHPFMYFPAFYITKELVMHKDNANIQRCLQDYKKNMKEDLLALWKIWVPCTLINFTFMPFHLRIPFTAGVSLVWTCILSIMRGGDIGHAEEMAGGAVTGATLHMLEEGFGALFTEPVQLESNKAHVVLTASGRDKPGWVALLAQAVADAGGNVTYSKMVRLGHEFIILMHVSVPPENRDQLLKSLRKTKELKPLNIRTQIINRRETGSYQAPVSGVRIRCQGPDKPGMLLAVSQALTAAGLNIENVHTELVRGGKKHDEVHFLCTADTVAIEYMSREQISKIVKDLEALKESLHLDVVDIRVQRLKNTESEDE